MMEQLEKAMAKAREMRFARGGSPFPLQNGPSQNSRTGPVNNGIAPEYTETATLPVNPRQLIAERLVGGSVEHPAAHVYGLLRTQVLQRMKEKHLTTLAVTSPQLDCGASTTAANLALSIAMDVNQTVLLVDLNLRAPGLHRKFNFQPGCGIEDYLRGAVQLNECLVSPGIPRLVILPARQPNPDAAEVLRSPRMVTLARELKSRYADRIIIYDTPPLLPSSDTLGFLPNVDGVLLVVRNGRTTKHDIERSASLLEGRTMVGTLINAQVDD
jgi:protein-tyrosine kinase